MKISVAVVIILISACIVNASILDPVIENVVHHEATKPPSGVSGMWKKKTIWKPRWIKEWKSAKVMKPVWRKIWSPVQIREWVPIPKPPPGWDAISTPLSQIQTSSKGSAPLWDPIPYPESQQPPPASPQIFSQSDSSCGQGGCGDSSTFNQQQISGIIGSHGQGDTQGYSQGAEYSEYSEYAEYSVNHLTRVSPNGNRWTPPNQSNIRFNNGFFQELPSFLVPPRFQPLPGNEINNPHSQRQIRPQSFNNQHGQFQISQSQQLEANQNRNNGLQPWSVKPAQNIKGHFITKAPDQPYKIQLPEPQIPMRNITANHNPGQKVPGNNSALKPNHMNKIPHSHTGSDFIQPAELVSEYHYSEFDLTRNVKPEGEKTIQQEGIFRPHPNTNPLQAVETEPTRINTAPTVMKNNNLVVDSKPRQVRTDNGPQPYAPTGSQFQYSPASGPSQHFQQNVNKPLPQIPPTSKPFQQHLNNHFVQHHTNPPSGPSQHVSEQSANRINLPATGHFPNHKSLPPSGPSQQSPSGNYVNHQMNLPTSGPSQQSPSGKSINHQMNLLANGPSQQSPSGTYVNQQMNLPANGPSLKPFIGHLLQHHIHSSNNAMRPGHPTSIPPTSQNQHNSTINHLQPSPPPPKPPQVHFAFFEPKPYFHPEKPMTTEIFPIYKGRDNILNSTSSQKDYKEKPHVINQNSSVKPLTQSHSLQPLLKSEINFHPTSAPQSTSTTAKEATPERENEISQNEITTKHSVKSSSETTPFTVYPSSFPTSTEAVTKSPVFVVTPIYVAQT